jgi:serine/threonine protein kinase
MNDGLLIGGKYRLRKPIGAGGMGQVWIARNEVTERDFAIKLLLPQAASSPQVVTRFIQEAKVSGRLRHPGILEIYDVGTATELHGAPFLVMELLHGVPLDAAIRSLRGLPVRFTLLVGIAVTRALRAAHDKGVVHRDLKPANVFLHRDESGAVIPKLLDFGISKLEPADGATEESLGLTQTGALLGSPRFMSPEQVASQKDIDGRSDLHALGVLLWWCLLARSPFSATTFNTLMYEILADARPRLLDAKPDVPPGLDEIVSRAFARKREDRYRNAGEALAALEEELAKLGPGPSLESRAWVDELLDHVPAPPPAAAALPTAPPALGKDTTTHGAVSVSLKPDLDGASPAAGPVSPAASTSDGRSAGFVSASTKRRRTPLVVGVTLGGLVGGLAIAGAVVMAGRTHAAGPPPASIAPLPAAASPAPTETASTSTVALAPAVVDAAAPQPRPVEARPAALASPAVGPSGPARSPAKTAPAKRAADTDPFRGVTGTGL